jgi:outer membrane protein assembly factor BamB
MLSLGMLLSCQKPTLLKEQIQSEPLYFTESINNARQGFLDIKMPEQLELRKESKLRGLANHTVLNISDNLVLTTRNGFLHILRGRDLESDQNTKISLAISSTPAYYRGLLFITSELGKEGLKAYDIRRGKIIWAKKGYRSKASPVVENNLVFHAAMNGKVLALNVSSGEVIWEGSLNDKIVSSMAYSEGFLTAVSVNGTIRTFDSTSGSVIWSLDIAEAVHTHPVIRDNHIILLTYSGNLIMIHLKRGTVVQQIEYDVPFYQAATVDQESIYLPFSDGYVISLDRKTREVNWTAHLDGPLSTGILATKNHVYCGTGRKQFYVIDKSNGKIIQNIKLEGRPRSLPLATKDRLYVAYERKMIALLSSTEDTL